MKIEFVKRRFWQVNGPSVERGHKIMKLNPSIRYACLALLLLASFDSVNLFAESEAPVDLVHPLIGSDRLPQFLHDGGGASLWHGKARAQHGNFRLLSHRLPERPNQYSRLPVTFMNFKWVVWW